MMKNDETISRTKTFATVGLLFVVTTGIILYYNSERMKSSSSHVTQTYAKGKHVVNEKGAFQYIPDKYNKSHHYICPAFDGGTGNQMFQFASSYGIARHKNMSLIIPEQCKLMTIFKLRAVILKDISVCKGFRVLREYQNAIYDRRLVEFDSKTNVRLTIYLQAFRYFDKYRNEIRKQFTFRDEIQIEAFKKIHEIFKTNNIVCDFKNGYATNKNDRNCRSSTSNERITLIGVHIRRGDWLRSPHPGLGFQTASKEYFQRAVAWYQKRYNNIHYIIATNGLNWTKENFPKNVSVSYLENNSPAVDMAVLTLSDHFIASVGTFSWWTGWIVGGNMTYFKWPARENTSFRRTFGDFKDHFYPSWIGL